MRAGLLRNRIVIEQAAESQSSSGAITETWSTFATVWANIEPKSGREYFKSRQNVEELTLVIEIRHYPEITSKMRVTWAGRVFDIKSIINVGERDIKTILGCVETFNVARSSNAFSSEFSAEFA